MRNYLGLALIPQAGVAIGLAALGALVTSLLNALSTYGGLTLPFLEALPFASIGFGWLIPAAVCGVLGALIPGELPEQQSSSHP